MLNEYTDPTTMQFDKTLARNLIPVADKLRDQFTRFGLRPYKIRVVRIQWSAGDRGVGTPVIISEIDILPTPLVQDLSMVTEIVHPIGLDEAGTIIVSQVSGRFTDEDLRFAGKHGEPPGPDEEVFYEIEFPRADGLPGDKRRFYLRSAPHYYADQFEWHLRLEKSHEDRARNGDYE